MRTLCGEALMVGPLLVLAVVGVLLLIFSLVRSPPPFSPLCAVPLTTCPHMRTLLLHVLSALPLELEFEAALLTVSLLSSPNSEFVQSLYYSSNIYYVSSNISTSVNEIVEITASACWWSECAQMCCAGRTRCNRKVVYLHNARGRVCSLCFAYAKRSGRLCE